jgi:hypothetical protein
VNTFLATILKLGLISPADAARLDAAVTSAAGNPEEAQAIAEERLTQAFQQGLLAQNERLFRLLGGNENPTKAQWDAFWKQEDAALLASVQPALTQTAQQAAIFASVKLADDGWKVVNEAVIKWANDYYTSPTEFGSVENLNQTSRRQVAKIFEQWQRGEFMHSLGLPSLALELEETFGIVRAQEIAITETTRIHAEAVRQTGLADPDVDFYRFLSSSDEKVCGYCGPLHGQVIIKTESGGFMHPTLGRVGIPPIHVRCRCRLVEETKQTAKVPLRDDFKFEGKLPAERKGLSYSKPKAKKVDAPEAA